MAQTQPTSFEVYEDLYMKSFEYVPKSWKNRPLDDSDPDAGKLPGKEDIHILDYGTSLTKGGNVFNLSPILVWPSETLKLKKTFREIFDPDRVFSFDHVLGDKLQSNLAKRSLQDFIDVPSNKVTSSTFISHIPQSQIKQYGFYDRKKYGVLVGKSLFEGGFKSVDIKLFEHFNDALFSKLQVRKDDRLAYTEPIGIVPKFRKNCLELFFECYELGAVMPCVDSISASYEVLTQKNKGDAIIVDISESQITILVFIQSNLRVDLVRTIPIGMGQVKTQFASLLRNKYPVINGRITPKVFENIFTSKAFVSRNYLEQLRFFRKIEYKNQMEGRLPEEVYPSMSLKYFHSKEEHRMILENERLKRTRRQEQAKKASKIMRIRREEKKSKFKETLLDLKRILQMVRENDEMGKIEMEDKGFQTVKELDNKVFGMRMKLGEVGAEELEQRRFGLLSKKDEDLTEEQRRMKKYQKMQKINAMRRKEKKEKQEREQKKIQELRDRDPGAYLQDLKSKRQSIKSKLKRIKTFKEDTNFKKQKDSKILEKVDNYLDGKYEPEDELQMEDFINEMMELSSDCEKYEVQLIEVEAQIKEMDPGFDEDLDNEDVFLLNKYNNQDKIFFGVDITRSCESLLKPYLLGMEHQGLMESLVQILTILPPDIQRKLLQNIYLVGGGAHVKGLDQRLKVMLQERFAGLEKRTRSGNIGFNVCKPGLNQMVETWADRCKEVEEEKTAIEEEMVQVHVPGNSLELGYSGMCRFIRDSQAQSLQKLMISREEYYEYGPSLFKPGVIGNI